MKSLQSFLFTAYFCLLLIVLGGVIFCVLVEYPNWFADLPSSLAASRNFYKVLHPGYFFQTLAPLGFVAGVGFLIAGWRITPVRNFVLISLTILVAAEFLTFFYIYPRLDILFGPGSETTSIEILEQAARQFTVADRIRTGITFVANGFGIGAMFRFFKHRYALD
jgi:hypothetical protein